MKSLWNDTFVQQLESPLDICVYASQLLGSDSSLVLHGGGNTSVKDRLTSIFGESEEILWIKGSGFDLASISRDGFAPVHLPFLRRLAYLPTLSDTEMMEQLRLASRKTNCPAPSVEALVHAIIPFQYVFHTHADAVVTISNSPNGEELLRQIYGQDVLIAPYVMPGFDLAQDMYNRTLAVSWENYRAVILAHHGVFTFANSAREAYENMITLVHEAEAYLERNQVFKLQDSRIEAKEEPKQSSLLIAEYRKAVSSVRRQAILARLDQTEGSIAFANWPKAFALASRGTTTPDHVIHIKPFPLFMNERVEDTVPSFVREYTAYFARNAKPFHLALDSAPRWGIWPYHGVSYFAHSPDALQIVQDIVMHTISSIVKADSLGGWTPVPESDLFRLEYWELEQAKLKRSAKSSPFLGQIALITGAASGIGLALTKHLLSLGCSVIGLDIKESVVTQFHSNGYLGLYCDVTNSTQVKQAIERAVCWFGGIDYLVLNAGIFPSNNKIELLDIAVWEKSLQLNLSSHADVLKLAIPYLKLGIAPSVVIVASKNVPAPGPGAAAYSCAKAALTQLGRIAALELAPYGIRVNMIHPDAVFDTGIWSMEVIANRANHYQMSIEEYKKKNLLKTELTSSDVAQLIEALLGKAFAKTTGAQIPIDGGNDRVI